MAAKSGASRLHSRWNTLDAFKLDDDEQIDYYSLPALEKAGIGKIHTLPLSIRIVLESLLRNIDGASVRENDVVSLANWNASQPADVEVPFKVARVLMQDFTGVPAVVDLAAMREAVKKCGSNPDIVQPQVPVDLVIDHSVQVDSFGSSDSFMINREKEFERNAERYSFLKWASGAFRNFRVMPPSLGIVHQVNLEYLATCVTVNEIEGRKLAYPDTLVGTDSHTTMVNGIGVLGFGVGGIEAEAAMLNQPVTFAQPEVVGVNIRNRLPEGVTATDLTLTLTQMLRKENVVGKFVEFFGDGIKSLSIPDRATMSNMCPEYGATIALFPIDEETLSYLKATARSSKHLEIIRRYYKAQEFSGIDYSRVKFSKMLDLDLSGIEPSVAGPKLPQSRVSLSGIRNNFVSQFFDSSPPAVNHGGAANQLYEGGNAATGLQTEVYRNSEQKTVAVEYPTGNKTELSDGDVVIAAITSCTNTSNPAVMIAAGLLAKKAVEKGLSVQRKVKTSLAPGSRVVTDYLRKAGLSKPLEQLGFYLVGYGCTTCIGNSGPLPEPISKAIAANNLSVCSVLSGNRNFEARIHNDVRANYLMSPPLVVAFALAGTVLIDMTTQPLSRTKDGKGVYLRDIWPSSAEIQNVMNNAITPDMYRERYSNFQNANEEWNRLESPSGLLYRWDENSTYIQLPPFFSSFDPSASGAVKSIKNARVLCVFGDSVTTDHISPAGAFSPDTPAGKYLIEKGVQPSEFNTYGSRRGNDRIMTRGTFANKRIKNLLLPGTEGGFTLHFPDRRKMTIFDAAMEYSKESVPLVVIAGNEYGSGSSRDWAAKGPMLLGVKAVIAKSFERIHRSNLIGMGVLPLQFEEGKDPETLSIDFSGTLSIILEQNIGPRDHAMLSYMNRSGAPSEAKLIVRLDTEVEVEYFKTGGILPFVLKRLLKAA
ncbi:MAG: aconitate hydratase AcnA [Candidatus Thermoplasmatota archaeon]|nr:aconitate hydratase AcnA [Candidatus Thermoplasmatota archaeon]